MSTVAPIRPETEQNPIWETQAACKASGGGMTSIFFSDNLSDIAMAKSICSECPVMTECLGAALNRDEQWGVWGGQLFISGRIVAQKRGRGRPPKTPRAEDMLPEIPFPESLQHLRSA